MTGCYVVNFKSGGRSRIVINPECTSMAIAANKFKGVRAANCFDQVMAELSRRHNNANVLCLPGDLIGDRPIDELVNIWLSTEFEAGRHERRLEKIGQIEEEHDSGGGI